VKQSRQIAEICDISLVENQPVLVKLLKTMFPTGFNKKYFEK